VDTLFFEQMDQFHWMDAAWDNMWILILIIGSERSSFVPPLALSEVLDWFLE